MSSSVLSPPPHQVEPETVHAGTIYAQLSDEIKHHTVAVSNKRKVLHTKESQLIEDLVAKSVDTLETQDGRIFLLSYKNKKPSLANKKFLSKGLEMHWNQLSQIEHNMDGAIYAERTIEFMQELQKQQAQQNPVPFIKEKGAKRKKQKTADTDGAGGHQSLLLDLLGD